jgi:MYXO-CTERM domain-containing protein
MRRLSLLLALAALLLAVPLSGFKYIDPPRKWSEAEMPIRYYLGDAVPTGLTEADVDEVLTAAHQAWADVPCSPLRFEYAGRIENIGTFNRPDRTQITFHGNLSSGVLAATLTHGTTSVLSHNGKSFSKVSSYNIQFNSGFTWSNPERIASPQCFGEHSFLGVATHEIGHGLGLGHSCDSGEACPDPILRAATMYWSGDDCDPSQEDVNEDDMAGINAIYGVAVDFDLLDEQGEPLAAGEAPLTAVVSVPDTYLVDRFDGFEWSFGDGTALVDLPNGDPLLAGYEHTWQEAGQYTITLTGYGDDATCGGEFDAVRRKVGAVLACDLPAPAMEYTNDGDYVVQMVNTSPLGGFGCTSEYEWTLDGDTAGSLRTYEPTYSFDDEGAHTVTLKASGPAGEASVDLEIEVTKASDAGCSASVAGTGGVGMLGLLLGLGIIRRRVG